MTTAEEPFELSLRKVFFIFGKHYAVFFGGEWGGRGVDVLAVILTGFRESVIFQLFVMG